MPIHGSLFTEYAETAGQDPFTLQNKKMLKIQMQYGPVNCKLGSMVAYQGDVRFQNTGSGGLNKMLKSKLTGEGVNMMDRLPWPVVAADSWMWWFLSFSLSKSRSANSVVAARLSTRAAST